MAAGLGFLFLAEMPALLGAVMLMAGGGIVFITFQNIAVEAHLWTRQAPAFAAVAGVAIGIAGHHLVA